MNDGLNDIDIPVGQREGFSSPARMARAELWQEWWEWATKSQQPSRGLDFLDSTGWILHYPMLAALRNTEQDPRCHPEGNVWTHTLHVCNAAAAIADRERLTEFDRTTLLVAALCHDVGKPPTTYRDFNNQLVCSKHAAVGAGIALEFLELIDAPRAIRSHVVPLVREHLADLSAGGLTARAVRRLAVRLGSSSVRMWSLLVEADASGRPPLPAGNPVLAWVELAAKLGADKRRPRPLLRKRHLRNLEWIPSRAFGRVLALAFDAQIEGAFDDVESGLRWIQDQSDELLDGSRVLTRETSTE